jgi:hypothetical protein
MARRHHRQDVCGEMVRSMAQTRRADEEEEVSWRTSHACDGRDALLHRRYREELSSPEIVCYRQEKAL